MAGMPHTLQNLSPSSIILLQLLQVTKVRNSPASQNGHMSRDIIGTLSRDSVRLLVVVGVVVVVLPVLQPMVEAGVVVQCVMLVLALVELAEGVVGAVDGVQDVVDGVMSIGVSSATGTILESADFVFVIRWLMEKSLFWIAGGVMSCAVGTSLPGFTCGGDTSGLVRDRFCVVWVMSFVTVIVGSAVGGGDLDSVKSKHSSIVARTSLPCLDKEEAKMDLSMFENNSVSKPKDDFDWLLSDKTSDSFICTSSGS